MSSSAKKAIDFESALSRDRALVEKRLKEITGSIPDECSTIREAVGYSLLGGGKRLRPILCLWTHDAAGGKRREVCLDMGCAIEALHTYSLIHDDLPSMDDDEMRRGKPSSHRRFGEAMAILAGDALLTMSFEIIASCSLEGGLDPGSGIEVVGILSRAAGAGGLISGQVLDLQSPELQRELGMVDEIHRKKTGMLISASMEIGAVVAGAGEEIRRAAAEAGLLAGRAFQIMDDILDVEGESGALGKTGGKDLVQGKLTCPAVIGLEASRERAGELIDRAKERIGGMADPGPLVDLFDYILARTS